jgi:hypothetical protein
VTQQYERHWILQVESQHTLVHLPLQDLWSTRASHEARANTAGWTQKMRDTFTELATKANHAYGAATETVTKVAKAAGALDLPSRSLFINF